MVKDDFLSACKWDEVTPPGIGPAVSSMHVLLVAFTQSQQCE